MKRLITILITVLINVSVFAQAPQLMSYQAVIRDSVGKLVTSKPIGMRISILQGSITGIVAYKEIYSPDYQTNANGLVTLEIGGGTPITGTFANINWANGPYFIKTETDTKGGTNYSVTGISQLLSVPYALYAEQSGTIAPGKSPLNYLGIIVFGASSLWACPANVTSIIVELWSAGGGGTSGGGNGGTGGYIMDTLNVIPGKIYNITVGTGGVGNSTSSGETGGTTSFSTLLSVTGGTGGFINIQGTPGPITNFIYSSPGSLGYIPSDWTSIPSMAGGGTVGGNGEDGFVRIRY